MQLMGRAEAFKIFTERETIQSGWYCSLAALTAMHISMSLDSSGISFTRATSLEHSKFVHSLFP